MNDFDKLKLEARVTAIFVGYIKDSLHGKVWDQFVEAVDKLARVDDRMYDNTDQALDFFHDLEKRIAKTKRKRYIDDLIKAETPNDHDITTHVLSLGNSFSLAVMLHTKRESIVRKIPIEVKKKRDFLASQKSQIAQLLDSVELN